MRRQRPLMHRQMFDERRVVSFDQLIQERLLGRFKERSQAPMLKEASRYFAKITGGEFEGLFSDDLNTTPVTGANYIQGSDGDVLHLQPGGPFAVHGEFRVSF